MCHGSGAISSLFVLVIPTWMQSKHRRCSNACNSRNRQAQTRVTQLDDALQQGGRPATSGGQVVDTCVLGRPDWDGSEKAWPSDESFRGSHRPGAVNGHDRGRDQYGCVEQRKHDASQEVQECAVVFRPQHVVHCRAPNRISHAPHGSGMEAWRMLFQACSPKNIARLVVMMLEVLAFPSKHVCMFST